MKPGLTQRLYTRLAGTPTLTSWPSRLPANTPTGCPSWAISRWTGPRAETSFPAGSRTRGMLGLRFSFQGAGQENWPTDGTMDWLWPAVAEAGIPVALMASGLFARGGADCGAPPRREADRRPLGAHPRRPGRSRMGQPARPVGLGEATPTWPSRRPAPPATPALPYPFSNIHDYLHRIYDAFGPDRMFWGTDITRMPCSWRAMRHHVHRRIALALRRRQGTDNGPRPLQLDRVGPSRLRNYLKAQCGTQQTRYSTQPVIPAKAGNHKCRLPTPQIREPGSHYFLVGNIGR